MTITKTIPAEQLNGLDVHPGDTLHVVAVTGSAALILINRRDEAGHPAKGKASAWLRSAKGSVHLDPGEMLDDVRMDFYRAKYGLAT